MYDETQWTNGLPNREGDRVEPEGKANMSSSMKLLWNLLLLPFAILCKRLSWREPKWITIGCVGFVSRRIEWLRFRTKLRRGPSCMKLVRIGYDSVTQGAVASSQREKGRKGFGLVAEERWKGICYAEREREEEASLKPDRWTFIEFLMDWDMRFTLYRLRFGFVVFLFHFEFLFPAFQSFFCYILGNWFTAVVFLMQTTCGCHFMHFLAVYRSLEFWLRILYRCLEFWLLCLQLLCFWIPLRLVLLQLCFCCAWIALCSCDVVLRFRRLWFIVSWLV